ncbi:MULTISPECIES: GmrSD restriction endonuclease domain-containing protein [Pasteurellaceae]|uniref:GmrSD restriction endonuclease domain-containing protein n=4 Tax=Pasteurellales TaxID=135625 RepID=UPI00068A2064
MQKKFTAKIVQISDIVEWYSKGEINYSPKYQRNSVWNNNAKSYLIDTIIRGMPIPPIFLHQRVDISTRKNNREVIDGQQRLRAIIDFVHNESFSIMKKHNQDVGDMYFEQLDDDYKREILQYEIVAQVINEEDESVIYDMFSRLNSNNVVLNKQEIRNSKYWGDFKVIVYQLLSKYRSFIIDNKIVTEKEVSRMKDAELINSLLILLIKGIVSENPRYIDEVYEEFNDNFEGSNVIIEKFDLLMNDIFELFSFFIQRNIFSNKNYFYTLFAILAIKRGFISNLTDGITNSASIMKRDGFNLNNKLDEFISNIENALSKDSTMSPDRKSTYQEINELHRRHTTDKNKRQERILRIFRLLGD